jgi:hypothetical protein
MASIKEYDDTRLRLGEHRFDIGPAKRGRLKVVELGGR